MFVPREGFLELHGCTGVRFPIFQDGLRTDSHRSAVSVLVQIESRALLRLALDEGTGYGTMLALQGIASPVTDLHGILKDMSHYLMGQMSGESFGAMVPEANSPFLIHDVDSDWKAFHQVPE